MLKALHAGNLLCAGVFIMRAELVFISFFSGLAHLKFGCVQNGALLPSHPTNK